MRELRQTIDALDRKLIALLADRAVCIDRAAELKQLENLPARIPARVEEVAANARRNAAEVGLDPDLADKLWREMIEWAIAREEAVLGPSRGPDGKDMK
ncbi:chorismate mutase [Pseudodonghicola flavimaris]|uniref:chorismate mutase n=1 Tax=Pseudodonghicola flavimaris TaxID=3050036 RepID=A0ABT7EXR5_9RHOB|nr:chorismate mutase [Pseudodonghicola flavimaris]MDK3017141.1 chorismate mutase [Pseudodonghicola flavimaris]